MLVCRNSINDYVDCQFKWHIGEDFPPDFKPLEVLYVQADGDELLFIHRLFLNDGGPTIPFPNKRVVRWYGDIAKTIAWNVCSAARNK